MIVGLLTGLGALGLNDAAIYFDAIMVAQFLRAVLAMAGSRIFLSKERADNG